MLSMKKKELEEDIDENLSYINEKVSVLETMKEDIESSLESIIRDTSE